MPLRRPCPDQLTSAPSGRREDTEFERTPRRVAVSTKRLRNKPSIKTSVQHRVEGRENTTVREAIQGVLKPLDFWTPSKDLTQRSQRVVLARLLLHTEDPH